MRRKSKPRVPVLMNTRLGLHSSTAQGSIISYEDPEAMSKYEIAMELISYGARTALISNLTKLHPDAIQRLYQQKFHSSAPQGRTPKTAIRYLVTTEARRQASVIGVYYHNIINYSNSNGGKDAGLFHRFPQHLLRVFRRYQCNERKPLFNINDVATIMRDMEVNIASLHICNEHKEPLFYLYYADRTRALCPHCQPILAAKAKKIGHIRLKNPVGKVTQSVVARKINLSHKMMRKQG